MRLYAHLITVTVKIPVDCSMLTLTLRRILLNCISICTGLEKTEFLLEIKAALDPYEVSLAKLSVEAKTVEVHSVRFGDDYTGWRGDGQEDT